MRITQKDIEQAANRINDAKGAPTATHTRENGVYRSNIGNYHISYAYGGVSLHKMTNEGGGVEDVFRCGHVTKRDLYNRMQAFLTAIE